MRRVAAAVRCPERAVKNSIEAQYISWDLRAELAIKNYLRFSEILFFNFPLKFIL